MNKLLKWGLKNRKEPGVTIREMLAMLQANLNKNDTRPLVHLGIGDPSVHPCFRTTPLAENAIVHSLRSSHFNGYAPSAGISAARRAVADYLCEDLPYKLSEEDVFLTAGGNHAIEILLTVLARPGANILFPRPGYPLYEARAEFSGLEVRHFDLVPDRGWEVDLDAIEALADDKTIAMVTINPGNPCGNVFTFEHMQRIAETARRKGIILIADEVYGHLVFGDSKFVPMGTLGSVAPILTLGTLSKRWLVPGWRLGWIAATDPQGILSESGVTDSIRDFMGLTADPATIIQGAVPEILKNSPQSFFLKTNNLLREAADVCYTKVSEIPSLKCSHRPEGAMSTMVKLNLSTLDGVVDDMDFALKLAKEESVLVMPGTVVGLKNWLRVSFAVELDALKVGFERIGEFSSRHAKK
ncbi:nicotianamine aminotransferase 1-like [Andrographis paniculata]|uniref:nicotianamine aminotransferase 1-like n=1 Tax=Andrographis paniculata TaxID=175694 RepID=UPI0021E7E931|nr:nicotianamine aminotransferase 1-like [Andrographis paniculata]